MEKHPCPISGCKSVIPQDKLLCWRHWRYVPGAIQSRVYRTWNNGYPLPGYLDARNAAVASVEGTLERHT